MIMLPNATKIYFLHAFLVVLKYSLLTFALLSLFLCLLLCSFGVVCLWITLWRSCRAALNPKSSNVYALIQ